MPVFLSAWLTQAPVVKFLKCSYSINITMIMVSRQELVVAKSQREKEDCEKDHKQQRHKEHDCHEPDAGVAGPDQVRLVRGD